MKQLKQAAKERARRSWRRFKEVCGGENAPFAVMMVLTMIYMVAELVISLVSG